MAISGLVAGVIISLISERVDVSFWILFIPYVLGIIVISIGDIVAFIEEENKVHLNEVTLKMLIEDVDFDLQYYLKRREINELVIDEWVWFDHALDGKTGWYEIDYDAFDINAYLEHTVEIMLYENGTMRLRLTPPRK